MTAALDTSSSRYALRERIATGGMGTVWRAEDTLLGRPVAVKVLKDEYADDSKFRTRFLFEARSAASLHHPGIAGVFDYGEGPDQAPYLVMELVEGQPLSALIQRGVPMPPEQARSLVRQAAAALGEAHRQGIVHRDVKPANLLVTPDERVKVTDFGIARAADGMALTRTGEIIGTPHYLSPEQAEGETATAASDVYSLGVVLYECLTGDRPFHGDTPVTTALAHLRQPVPDLPESVPADLRAVCARALAKDPARRYPDAATFAAALDGKVETTSVTSSRPAPGAATAASAADPTLVGIPGPLATTAAGEPDSTRRRAWWPLAAAAVGVALVIALISLLPSGSETPAPRQATSPTATPAARAHVRAAAYVGEPRAVAVNALHRLGFKHVNVSEQTNPGGHPAGTVAKVSPTGLQPLTTTISLGVWGAAPVPTPTVAPTPTTSPGNNQGNGNGQGNGQRSGKSNGSGHGHGHGHGKGNQ